MQPLHSPVTVSHSYW